MKLVIQKQVHGSEVTEVTNSTEIWLPADAMVTTESDIGLVVYGADSAIIAFWKDGKIGVCHAGLSGYTKGLVKKMAEIFAGGECYVGPFYHRFDIRKDSFFKSIVDYGGSPYIIEDIHGITFNFKKAIQHELIGLNVMMDPRCTFDTPDLASFKREHKDGFATENRLVIWMSEGKAMHRLFKPGENLQSYFNSINTSP